MTGTLYIIATPIGNLEDITLRALRVLREVDWIACEDTRQTRKLLEHFGIAKPMVSYHEHNESGRAAELVGKLTKGGSGALVSDAGTPGRVVPISIPPTSAPRLGTAPNPRMTSAAKRSTTSKRI